MYTGKHARLEFEETGTNRRLQLTCGRERTIPPILLEHGVPSGADRHPLSERNREGAAMDCKPLQQCRPRRAAFGLGGAAASGRQRTDRMPRGHNTSTVYADTKEEGSRIMKTLCCWMPEGLRTGGRPVFLWITIALDLTRPLIATSSTFRAVRSQAPSLLSIARLNIARSRIRCSS